MPAPIACGSAVTESQSLFTPEAGAAQFQLRSLARPGKASTLAEDIRHGFAQVPKSLPPKHFYDKTGSELFDQICRTEEYYQTRTEQRLLESVARNVIDRVAPSALVELGSGAARKTCTLLDAIQDCRLACRYVPFDVSGSMLESSARRLIEKYPWLRVDGIVGDYDYHLHELPVYERRLFVFFGGTIGNFEVSESIRFLSRLRSTMQPGDALLLGTDLVKQPAVLNRAYNDAKGITAAFNKNVLRVINRELRANFDLDDFRHVAFFNERQSRIEMHLEALRSHDVEIEALEMVTHFSQGERILTEISRKFTRKLASEMLVAAGFVLDAWYPSADDYFALSLCRPN